MYTRSRLNGAETKALLVEPMKRPNIAEITASLEELHGTVGGRIEVLYPFEDESGVICGDESKYDGSLPNRLLEDYDVIFGNFLTCGLSAADFDSLSDKMAETHRTMKTILYILSAERVYSLLFYAMLFFLPLFS